MKNNRQSGYTFIELSVVLVVLGLVAMLLSFLFPAFRGMEMKGDALRNQQEVREALLGFAYTHGRLPYADNDNDGLENAATATGYLPYRTLGLSAPLRNSEGLDYRYGVYLRADGASPQNDADLGVGKDRFYPMIADGLKLADNPPTPLPTYPAWVDSANPPVVPTGARPVAARRAQTNTNQMDYCKALDVAQQYPGETTSLHLVSGALGGTKENVAYVLADPGAADMNVDGNKFDGVNAVGLGFEHPTRGASMAYDDRVAVGYFNDMWERMGCAGLLSASGHAHPNVLSTTDMLRQSLQDMKFQVRLMVDMAVADNLQAGASVASAAAGLATAIANMSTDVASAINTAGVTSGAAVSAGIAIGLNTAAVVVASVNLAFTVTNTNNVKDQLANLEPLIVELEALHNSVKANVQASDHDAYSNQ